MQRDVNLRLTPDKGFDEIQIRKALHLGENDSFIILRRSIDARRKDIFVDISCRIEPDSKQETFIDLKDSTDSLKQAIVVGSGPAGLFASLTLLEKGIKPILIERGKDVHSRRVDIAGISTKGIVNPISNYSFGEGGAGTYSDGKLFTRSKKRGDNEKVLGTFVKYGANPSILYDAHPHIGTDKLPKIIENMRKDIVSHGGLVLFETQVISLVIENDICKGVVTKNLCTGEENCYLGSVILAVGNAARDTFEMLEEKGIAIESKSIAMGVRLEHPQHLIDCIQYHNPNGRGEYLPAAEYSFVSQVSCSKFSRIGVYSFCMCPGGFVVPAASDKEQVVVNGMSPSNRGSVWANSGMVVEIPLEILDSKDPLSMMRMQESLERKTWLSADKTQKAPSQRMVDFVNSKVSANLPKSSYSPGLTTYDLKEVLPDFVSESLKEGFKAFSHQAPQFMTNDAVLIGTETRTSSPVRIVRNSETLESINTQNLYPCGEGAGYAGGIVSAAIDGIRCAEKIAEKA